MAITACMVVANNYYNQPLLGEIAREFNISESEANRVSALTIFGYALGLFLIVPLGDKYKKKKLIVLDFSLIIASLLSFALSTNVAMLMCSAFFIGVSSVVPQMMVPLAAQLSSPADRSKNIGFVMSGLLIGILGSRVISGFVGAQYGWRIIFLAAAAIMFVLWMFIIALLPDVRPTFKGTYSDLMKSILSYIRKRGDLRIAALKGALSLASFQAFWTTLTFHVEQGPFFADSSIAGFLGIVGIGGALSTSYIGSFVDRVDKNKIYLAAILLMLLAWLFFGVLGFTYIGLIIGIFILDVGLQSIHVTNQSIIFAKDVEATNRLNTVYMTCYFLGGTFGAYIGGWAWSNFGWNGVVMTGGFFITILLVIQVIERKRK